MQGMQDTITSLSSQIQQLYAAFNAQTAALEAARAANVTAATNATKAALEAATNAAAAADAAERARNAYRRGTQRRRELHSKIQAVASAPLRAPFIKMRVTLDQLIRKHNCFSDVECDLWLVAHIVMTLALGTSPHAEWRLWIQVMGSDFEARHHANPAAFGWKELCECIKTREHTLYLTYGKPRGSTPEAHFLKTAKMGNEGSRTKQHCKYHDKEVAHTEDECLLNPANKAKKQEFEKKKKADADKRKANAEKKRAAANANKNDKNGKPSHARGQSSRGRSSRGRLACPVR